MEKNFSLSAFFILVRPNRPVKNPDACCLVFVGGCPYARKGKPLSISLYISCSFSIRFSVVGWLENSFAMLLPLRAGPKKQAHEHHPYNSKHEHGEHYSQGQPCVRAVTALSHLVSFR